VNWSTKPQDVALPSRGKPFCLSMKTSGPTRLQPTHLHTSYFALRAATLSTQDPRWIITRGYTAGAIDDGLALIGEAVERADRTDDVGLRAVVRYSLAQGRLAAGHFRKSLTAADEGLALTGGDLTRGARWIGASPYLILMGVRGAALSYLGRPDEAGCPESREKHLLQTAAVISRAAPAWNQSLAGIVQVPAAGPTCAGRIPRRRNSGGSGSRPLLKARMRSIPGSAANQGGGTLPRTGSSMITVPSYRPPPRVFKDRSALRLHPGQRLLPLCYQTSANQDELGATRLTRNPHPLAELVASGCSQSGPEENS
jgi:hypothetical protein